MATVFDLSGYALTDATFSESINPLGGTITTTSTQAKIGYLIINTGSTVTATTNSYVLKIVTGSPFDYWYVAINPSGSVTLNGSGSPNFRCAVYETTNINVL